MSARANRSCSREIIGLPLIDISTGTELGVVKVCLFSLDEKRLLGFIIGDRGHSEHRFGLALDDVRSIGQDSITVEAVECLVKFDDVSLTLGDASTNELLAVGKRVVTESGRDVGTVKDAVIDIVTGSVIGYEVSESVIQDILQGRNFISSESITTVGDEVVVVPDIMTIMNDNQ